MLQNARAIFNRQFYEYGLEKFQFYRDEFSRGLSR